MNEVYMCKIACECELGHDADGTKFYPSLEILKVKHPCWEECGVVKVKIELVEEIHKGEVL